MNAIAPCETTTSTEPAMPGGRRTKHLTVALVLNIPGGGSNIGKHVPISLLYLGTELKRAGHTAVVLDRRNFPRETDFLSALKQVGADLIGVPLYADCYALTYELINKVRRFAPSTKIVLGGPEVSANLDGVAQTFEGKADYLLCGEADYTLARLADALAAGDTDALESVDGLTYWIDGEIRHNRRPDPVKDIDDVPFPDRDLISQWDWKHHYYRIGLKRPSDVILTSRGCPFSCRFCYRLAPGYRARSPENVLDEMAYIYARRTRGLSIIDDNFLSSRRRCVAILEGMLRRGWKFTIKCRGSVHSVDPELLALMKRAGVRAVTYGLESGSQKVLDAMGKKTTVEQNYRAIRITREAGLLCYVDLFLGYPGETRETIRETSDFLAKARPTGINMGVLFPLHGTYIYDQARQDGTLVGDWGLLEDYPWVKLPWIDDAEDLWDEHRRASRRFWLNPRVVAGALGAGLRSLSLGDYWSALKEVKSQVFD